MSLIEASFLLIGGVEHLGDHHLGEGVFVNGRWTLVHKYIIKNLGKTDGAVSERNRAVEAEQGEVGVAASLVVRRHHGHLLRALIDVLVDLRRLVTGAILVMVMG